MKKKFRMFAGPNGSGKTSLISEIRQDYDIGHFVNADNIEREIQETGFIDLDHYHLNKVKTDDWLNYIENNKKQDPRISQVSGVSIKENIMVINSSLSAYEAAIIADFIKRNLLLGSETFSFETVMSHPSKVHFIKEVSAHGFKTYLYYIGTADPRINENRVVMRTAKGGHSVPPEKIEARYYRSMELLKEAFIAVDRAFIIDNSDDDQDRKVCIEKDGLNIKILLDEIPGWIDQYLLKKI